MKIALYQPWIYLHGGLEKSLLELVTRSRHEWVVYTGHYEAKNTFKEFANVDVRELNPTTVNRSIGATFKNAIQVYQQEIPDEGFDAVAVWCDGLGDLIAFKNHDLPLFNICSTPLRPAFDPVYEKQTLQCRSPLYRAMYAAFKYTFRWVDRHAWKHFDGVITTSTEVKNRIIEGKLCNDESKMVMAYPGIECHANLDDVQYDPFVLVSGRIMWTKNIQQAIETFLEADLPKPWKLVIAGFLDEKSKVYLANLKTMLKADSPVEFVISPSDEQLTDLYRRASFCLFPPLNEDWGIVPLECMNYGKAVIANASGGPLESIIDGKTGYLLPAEDKAGWVRAIRRLATNHELCRTLGKQAHAHVRKYDWNVFVDNIDTSFEAWAAQLDSKTQFKAQVQGEKKSLSEKPLPLIHEDDFLSFGHTKIGH